MLVVEVDVVHPEPGKGGLAGGPHVLRPPVHAHPAAVLAALIAELGRQHDLMPASGDGAADKLFVGERPIDVGSV